MAWLRVLIVLLLMTKMAVAEGVNAVIGDTSWIARFGVAPDPSTDDDTRVRVHLAYVEAVLRGRATNGLTEAQRAARAHNLDLLHAYIERGEFPRNFEVPGRRPHFIDGDGRICAVGYLIEQTAGRATAEAINAKHEWDFIGDIRGIDAWVAASGMTVEELAMIQPGYPWRPRPGLPVRPPPPPPDERAIRHQIIFAALSSAEPDVQRCAARFEMWSDRFDISATVGRGGATSVFVPRVGSRGFRRCAQRAVEARLAVPGVRDRRVFPMTVAFRFTIAGHRHDGGFAQPPPR
jgi:hypothetical protein